jgi:hypothetical protein
MIATLRHLVGMTRRALLARAMLVVMLATFFVPLLGGACCSGADWLAEAAEEVPVEADDCCPDDAETQSRPGSEPCRCPLPCSASCAGFLGRALPQVSTLPVLQAPLELTAPVALDVRQPSNPDPQDILHVPKRSRA